MTAEEFSVYTKQEAYAEYKLVDEFGVSTLLSEPYQGTMGSISCFCEE